MKLTKKHRTYFNAAKAVSKLSNHSSAQIGAVAVYKHHIISSGCNSTKTNPLQKKLDVHRYPDDEGHYLHAETQCLLPLLRNKRINFKKVSLYIYREYKDGSIALCRPCKSCEKLIDSLGIRKVYYTGYGGFVHELM